MRRFVTTLSIVAAVVGVVAAVASADTTPQPLPLLQDWTNTGLITVDDNWSGVPGITGYRGDDLAQGTGVDPCTVLIDYSAPVDVNANHADPNTFITGGVTEFDGIPNPTVALQGSGTSDNPNLVIYVNTTGKQNIVLAANLIDIDGSADNSIQGIAVEYRVGNAGPFTLLFCVADASAGPSLAGLTTPVLVNLPAAANNQAEVDIRVSSANAIGSDEWIGIDDIAVRGEDIPVPTVVKTLGAVKAFYR